LAIYISLISLSMISSTFPSLLDPARYAQYAIVGTVFSLFYLTAFVYHVARRIQPENLITHTLAKMNDDEVLNEIIKNEGIMVVPLPAFKPLIILEQTLLKAVSNNDIFSFVNGMERLYQKLDGYLLKLYEEYKAGKKEGIAYSKQSEYVYKFFSRSLTMLETECFSQHREEFIMQQLFYLFSLLRITHGHKNIWILKEIWTELDYVGYKTFSQEMRAAASAFLRHFRSYSVLEIENAKSNIHMRHDPLRRAELSDSAMVKYMVMESQYTVLDSIMRLGVISAEKRIEVLTRNVIKTIHFILPRVFSIPDRITRRSLIYSLLGAIEKVHSESIKNGILVQDKDYQISTLYWFRLEALTRKNLKILLKHFAKCHFRASRRRITMR
jgi:hypothetical protein